MSVRRTGISINPRLLKEFDRKIGGLGYSKRSEALADLIREFLSKSTREKEVTGTIRVLYNNKLNKNVATIEHYYPCLVISSMNVHLDHNNCLATLVVKGKRSKLQHLSEKIKAEKGVKECRLGVR